MAGGYTTTFGEIKKYSAAALFPPSAQNGALAEDLSTHTLYSYDSSGPGWVAIASPGAAIAIDGLTGDVGATGPGVVIATVNSVGGQTATNVAAGAVAANAATQANTASTIVKRDINGDFAAHNLTLNEVVLANGTLANPSVKIGANGVGMYSLVGTTVDISSYDVNEGAIQRTVAFNSEHQYGRMSLIGPNAAADSKYIEANGNNSLNIGITANAYINFYVNGSYPLQVGKQNIYLAGFLDTPCLVFDPDSSGLYGGGDIGITHTGVLQRPRDLHLGRALKIYGATSGSVGITSPAVTTSYGLVLPAAQGGANTVLTNDGSGNLSFASVAASISIGALDAQIANADGLALVANVLSTQSADATHPGVVNTTAQTFGGTKTLADIIVTSSLKKGNYHMEPGENNAGNSSTAITVDLSVKSSQKVTMTGNCTFTLSNPQAGGTYVLKLLQDGTGSRTATWPVSVLWPSGVAPTLSGANKTDLVTLYYDGTSYYGNIATNY